MSQSRLDDAIGPEQAHVQDHVDATDETPLLPTDLPRRVAPSKKTQRIVVSLVFLVYSVVMIGDYLMDAPRQQILEEVICRRRFSDHADQPGVYDARCKDNDVQKSMAMVRMWLLAMQSVVPLAVQLPFGIMADKYGRSWLFCLSLSGLALEILWEMAIMYWSDHFSSIWLILYGNLFFLLGGGVPMILAMGFTILSDVVPAAERSQVFYSLQAVVLILGVVVHTFSAYLLQISPWLPMCIGVGLIMATTIISAFIPETLKYRHRADEQIDSDEAGLNNPLQNTPSKANVSSPVKRAWVATKASSAHMWNFLFRSKMIMLLIVAYGFFYVVRIAYTMIVLQYMSKRFNMSWSTATYYLSVCNLATAIFFLVGLPAISAWLTKCHRLGPVTRDLTLIRILAVTLFLSLVVLSVADAPWIYIVALMFASFGNGIATLERGLLSSVVEPHTVATLFTTLGLAESINGFWGSPFMGWLEGKGMELGGVWNGLPYMVCIIPMAFVTIAVFVYRPPRAVIEVENAAQEGH